MLFSDNNNKKCILKLQKTWKNFKCIWLSENASLRGNALYDSKYITFKKCQNYRESENISGCKRFG